MGENERPTRRYAKPIVVPESLELLRGPTSGVVVLPRYVKWSGNPRYDLDSPGRVVDLYRTVINEAATATDLYLYLDEASLKELWPSMWLPVAVRRAWEDRFPALLAHPDGIAA